ncbi:hypothetical protein BTZ20_1316 [Rhodococcus sp. MTM3W5.2]|nr:hypothetical protein BTZ20_1316 [Rhodococcus sp. MTM3W5.2]
MDVHCTCCSNIGDLGFLELMTTQSVPFAWVPGDGGTTRVGTCFLR